MQYQLNYALIISFQIQIQNFISISIQSKNPSKSKYNKTFSTAKQESYEREGWKAKKAQ